MAIASNVQGSNISKIGSLSFDPILEVDSIIHMH